MSYDNNFHSTVRYCMFLSPGRWPWRSFFPYRGAALSLVGNLADEEFCTRRVIIA